MKTLLISFSGTGSEKVVSAMSEHSHLIVNTSRDEIEKLVYKVTALNPNHVVAFGDYSGRDRDKLRIETVCNRKFRNTLINLPETKLGDSMCPGEYSKYAKGLGNSWCNLLSLLMINRLPKSTTFSFIHVPKGFKNSLAVSEVKHLLNTLVVK